jgi:hypothetical protein
VYPFIPEAPLNPGPATLPQAVVLATSLHSFEDKSRHLIPRRAHTPLLTIGGLVRSLLALVRPVLIRKRVNLFRLLVLRPMAMGALQAQGPLPQARVGSLSHNLTRLAGHPVPSLRLLLVAVTGPQDSEFESYHASSATPTYSNTFSSASFTDDTDTTPQGTSLRRPQASPRSPLSSVRNVVAAWRSRSPSDDKSIPS